MIKAVFFDLYHTLVRYEPPREETQARGLKELGIETRPNEAGITADEKLVLDLLNKMWQYDMKLVLFDDVILALNDIRKQGVTLGLISNIDRDIKPLLDELGLSLLLQVIVTSQDVGFNKPHPQIFQAALRRAGVKASEAIYVGDQYQIDVLGANKAGMKGVLLDRGDYFEETTDCPRVLTLTQLLRYL